jgi:leucyl-tRNA synthetase
VLNEIFYRRTGEGRITYYNPAEVEIKTDEKGQRISATLKVDGEPVESDGVGTMSKSKNNGVDPQDLIEKFGADTARFFVMSQSPPEFTLLWSDNGVEGASRFLKRLWTFASERASALVEMSKVRNGRFDGYGMPSTWPQHVTKLRRELHLLLGQADYDIQRTQFNTVASAAIKMLNAMQEAAAMPIKLPDTSPGALQAALHEGMSLLLRVLYPIAPHVSHALWRELGYAGDIVSAPWPVVDKTALEQDEIELVLQVNGKLRGHVRAPKAAGREQIEQLALAHEAVARFTEGRPVKKVVVVPGRLVNVVV